VVVNEVSNAGSFNNICGGTASVAGEDWVEIQNRGSTVVDISGYRMYDNAGTISMTAYVFPAGSSLAAGEIRLLCGLGTKFPTGLFIYGINGVDTITLENSAGMVVSTTGALTNGGTTSITYQLTNDGTSYVYAPATPGAPNAFPAPVPVPVSVPVPVPLPVTVPIPVSVPVPVTAPVPVSVPVPVPVPVPVAVSMPVVPVPVPVPVPVSVGKCVYCVNTVRYMKTIFAPNSNTIFYN
jgi:Lamin Tail Domain